MTEMFFLKFMDKELERDFREQVRVLNSKTYKVFVIEKPNGIFEVEKWLPDTNGLSTYLKMYSIVGKTSNSEECDEVWNNLFHYYYRPEMQAKVICTLKEFECEQKFKKVKNNCGHSKITEFPHKETA